MNPKAIFFYQNIQNLIIYQYPIFIKIKSINYFYTLLNLKFEMKTVDSIEKEIFSKMYNLAKKPKAVIFLTFFESSFINTINILLRINGLQQ